MSGSHSYIANMGVRFGSKMGQFFLHFVLKSDLKESQFYKPKYNLKSTFKK